MAEINHGPMPADVRKRLVPVLGRMYLKQQAQTKAAAVEKPADDQQGSAA